MDRLTCRDGTGRAVLTHYGKRMYCSTQATADCFAELEESIPRWISVEDRLPENLTSVIVHRKDGGVFIWEYFDTSPTDECWVDDNMNVYSFYDVTHWQPLPEPPKEE